MSAAGRAAHERASLSRESVLEAALTIADLEGLDALTMRRLAADLGAAPMALYRYFRNKDELVISLFDRVISAYEPEKHHHTDALGQHGHHARMIDERAPEPAE